MPMLDPYGLRNAQLFDHFDRELSDEENSLVRRSIEWANAAAISAMTEEGVVDTVGNAIRLHFERPDNWGITPYSDLSYNALTAAANTLKEQANV